MPRHPTAIWWIFGRNTFQKMRSQTPSTGRRTGITRAGLPDCWQTPSRGGVDANGLNPYELEIRGACYAAAYDDTGNSVYRQLAINDYKQALNIGYPLAKPAYDKLAMPLLAPMAELSKGSSGGNVVRMQQWLNQAGYLSGIADGDFGGGTQKAVKAYEKDNSLTPDGIADIAFLLSLYSKVEDGDALYLG